VASAALERFEAVALDGLGESTAATALEQTGVPVDASGNYQSAGSGDAGGFGEGLGSVADLDQVVERAEEERHVDARVGLLEVPRVATTVSKVPIVAACRTWPLEDKPAG
jgi:hypothetical protein